MLGWNSVSKLSHKRLFVFLGTCATTSASLNNSLHSWLPVMETIQLGQWGDAGCNKWAGRRKKLSEGFAFALLCCHISALSLTQLPSSTLGRKWKKGHMEMPAIQLGCGWLDPLHNHWPDVETSVMCIILHRSLGPRRSAIPELTWKATEEDQLVQSVLLYLDADKFHLNRESELPTPGNLQQWQSVKLLHFICFCTKQ